MTLFVRKLGHGTRLTVDDEATLAALAEPVRRVRLGNIVPEGTEPHSIVLVIEGWVCRYRQLENGKRQITSVFLPGDLCEPFGALPQFLDHSLAALTPVLMARVPPHALRSAARASPRIEEALWWDLLISDALHREHIVSLGRRSAVERLGHVFCELHFRLGMVGLVAQSSYDIALTQVDLADLVGLSAVHVNRSLQELRGSGLLSLQGRRLTIHDLHALRELSMFDPDYLPRHDAISAPAGHSRSVDQDRRQNR